ncbi:DUF4194 domain-containing protein [soil metagenome]
MTTTEFQIDLLPYARSVIKLLQGVVYMEEENYWKEITQFQIPIQQYLGQIGIELTVNSIEGFAYVNQPEAKEENDNGLPRLMRMRQLKYEHTLLCVLLREWLEEFDANTSEGSLPFITKGRIKEQVEIFFQDENNRTKLYKELDATIEYVRTNLGILRRNSKEDDPEPDRTQYEVRRIIKAMIPTDKMEEIRQKLKKQVEGNGSE